MVTAHSVIEKETNSYMTLRPGGILPLPTMDHKPEEEKKKKRRKKKKKKKKKKKEKKKENDSRTASVE
ncbi:unnamed protein product [Pleuronectes platessa]|uniref:Uncharacterized protein n=1 Tax=Pleuronectes platessa TaxID=8262 RepID=A0A9N7YQ49_PLEPL|nr:unnamed protein product [Pleuronectes platessa]